MSFMNFKIINAKKLKDKILKKPLKYVISFHSDFNHLVAHRDMEKNQGNKIKDSLETCDINWCNDVLTWIQSGKRTLLHFCFIFSHLN